MELTVLCFTDEFRMRSLVVWLCFGIVVLCTLNVESKRSHHIAHGQTGPILRSVVPTIGYTNIGIGPQIVSRRQQRQNEDEYEDPIDEEDDEDDIGYDEAYGGDDGGDENRPSDYDDEYDNDEDDEEGEDDSDNEELGGSFVEADSQVQGRQAYINIDYIEEPYVQIQRPQYNRVPVRSSNRKPTKTKPSKHSSHKKKPSTGHKKKPSSSLADDKPQPALPVKKKEQESVVNVSPISVLQTSNPTQKLQLRPVATSTQFIATPVADLILRLSISLAKPVGQGNNTSFNVPLRIYQGAVKKIEDPKVLQADVELSRPDNILTITAPSVDKDALEDDADVDEVDENDQSAEMPETELSRK